MALLQIKDLNFQYPKTEKPAVKNLNLTLRAGEFVVLCGESGCGKSTFLRLIKNELAPFGEKNGAILYQNQPLDELDERTAAVEIGFVFQNPDAQIVTDKVWHELAFGLENLGWESAKMRRATAEMAGFFGIEPWFRQDTDTLSGGQKQILNLAAVMAMQPSLLLLDEPTAQLDPIAAANFISTLQKLNRELGLTILLAEHRLEDVFAIADRVLLMEHGALIYDGPPRQFAENHPTHPMHAALPAAMRIHNALHADADAPLTVREGRQYVTQHFRNHIRALAPPPPVHFEAAAVEMKNISFRYQKDARDILRDVSFTVYEGEHFCIMGGNGCGKTTLLRTLAGLLKPYRGAVSLFGKKLGTYNRQTLYQGNIALLPQNPQTVFLENTLRADFEQMCLRMGLSAEESAQRTEEIACSLGLYHVLMTHPYDLSGGEQQKAALAKLLLSEPKILLLDEPTKGIDAHAKLSLARLLHGCREKGITIITVTHDIEFAANADRCGLFFDGELIAADAPSVFFSENHFYTTAAHRITKGHYDNAILCEDVIRLCQQNGRKEQGDA